jgi:hypothetical protein
MAARGPNNGSGFLEVGADYQGQVVINLPRDMTGHICFTPDQARHLSELLTRKADEADRMIASLLVAAKKGMT